jgi:hypothetical protein
MNYGWIGHKKDLNYKSHLWGFINMPDIYAECNTIVFCGAAGSRIYLRPGWHDNDMKYAINDKNRLGYKEITYQKFFMTWPELVKDMEMQIVVKKLTHV